MLRIVAASHGENLRRCASLFDEYARSIAHLAGESLEHQGFERELSSLPGAYAPPAGGMYLAELMPGGSDESSAVGCIAFRPMRSVDPLAPADECELKRMYVRPAHRGIGIGRALVERVLADAKAAGFAEVKLDTSSTMDEAIGLYLAMGFAACERYNDDPMPDTLYFRRRL
jgi:putative acetyltransferase